MTRAEDTRRRIAAIMYQRRTEVVREQLRAVRVEMPCACADLETWAPGHGKAA